MSCRLLAPGTHSRPAEWILGFAIQQCRDWTKEADLRDEHARLKAAIASLPARAQPHHPSDRAISSELRIPMVDPQPREGESKRMFRKRVVKVVDDYVNQSYSSALESPGPLGDFDPVEKRR